MRCEYHDTLSKEIDTISNDKTLINAEKYTLVGNKQDGLRRYGRSFPASNPTTRIYNRNPRKCQLFVIFHIYSPDTRCKDRGMQYTL